MLEVNGSRRGPIAYVLERYPELSQTFVDGEIRELVAAGRRVRVLAIAPGASGAEDAAVDVDYPPAHGPRDRLAAAAQAAVRAPGPAAHALAREPFWPPPDGVAGAHDVVRRIAPPRARGFARIAPWALAARGARHLHAHFAAEATDIARLLSALSGTPFSFTAHATDAFRDPAALRANLDACGFCVASCEYVRRHLAAIAPKAVAKLEVLTDAVDLERFERKRPYDPDGPVVAVARLVPKKGLDDLIRAAARLGGREFLIAGDGPERRGLEDLIAELRAPVRLLGPMPNSRVRRLVERASLFALPCVVAPDGDRDGIPVAIMEAMALELPVVSTREVGIPEAVDDDRGRLVPPRDPDALAAAIGELLSLDPETRAEMGRAGREWVDRHADRRTQARRLLDWIDS